MSELWSLGIAQVSALLRDGDVCATEVAESVLERIAASEPFARAWAYVDDVGVRKAAAAADKSAQTGEVLGMLHGIPIGVKDVIDVRGMPTGAGSAAEPDRIPSEDAGAVSCLRRNGAIILGKTETHEFAFGQGTPPTQNPRDPLRYAGGSSVGSGVAVAVGSAFGALGTDTGGSVRNPAAINGLVGIKPTAGLIDGSGVLNVSESLDQIGPIARTVEDCALLLEGMMRAEMTARYRAAMEAAQGAPDVRLAVDREAWGAWGVTPEVRSVVNVALRQLEMAGVELVEVAMPELNLALPASLALALSESVRHHRDRLRRAGDRYLAETRVMIEVGALVTDADVALARQVRDYLRNLIRESFRRLNVVALVSPTLPSIAPLAVTMSHELTGDTGNGSLSSALQMLTTANLTGMPALSVACGVVDESPVGLHLMGTEFSDGRLLEIAQAYESVTPWKSSVPVRCPGGLLSAAADD